MTSNILAQTPDNGIYRVGYQWQVWFNGQSACYSSKSRAQAELARLQRYEAPQKQALSLLETLYTQYDSMAEQYESLAAYIKTTFSLEKLNKVIDQLTADLMAVTECHPQMVQQPQAQAVAPTVWEVLGVSLSDWDGILDDNWVEKAWFSPIYAQQVQQAQAQAVGASMETAIVESREVAGDSDLTTSDKSPAEYAEMYHNGLLSEAELFRLCPLAMPMVAKRTAWMAVDPRADYSSKKATDQFGTKYHRSANGEWDSVTLIDGREGEGYTVDDALRMALAQAVPDSSKVVANQPTPSLAPYVLADENGLVWFGGMSKHFTETANVREYTNLEEVKSHAKYLCMCVFSLASKAKVADFSNWTVDASGETIHRNPSGCVESAPDSDEIEIEWTRDAQGESDGYIFDCYKGVDADGNSYYRTTSEQATGEPGMVKLVCLVKATLPDGREGQAETAEGALAIAKAKPYDGLTLGDFVEDELDRLAHPDSLGDLYRPTHNPPQFYPIEHIVTSRENGYYTLQVPEGHPLATYLEGFVTIRHAEHALDTIGYNVISLKSLLTFPRPKVVKSQIRKAITALCHVNGLAGKNDPEFINGVIKELEALAC